MATEIILFVNEEREQELLDLLRKHSPLVYEWTGVVTTSVQYKITTDVDSVEKVTQELEEAGFVGRNAKKFIVAYDG